jgi:hypothetical protein
MSTVLVTGGGRGDGLRDWGISIIAACLTVNQAAYLLGVERRRSLVDEQAGEEPPKGRNGEIAGKNQQKQRAQSEFA